MFKQRLFLAILLPLLLVACTAQTEPKPAQKVPTHFPTREEQPAPEQPEEPKDEPEEKIYFFPNSVLKDYYGTWRITKLAVGAEGFYETDQESNVIGQTVTVSEDNIAFLDYTFKISSIGHKPVEWYLEKSNFLIADSYWLCGGEIIFDEEKGEYRVTKPAVCSNLYRLLCNEDDSLLISLFVQTTANSGSICMSSSRKLTAYAI